MRVRSGQFEGQSDLNAANARASEADAGLSIGDVARMLFRRIRFILVCSLVCGLIAWAYSRSVVPVYEASATIRIDQDRANSLGLGDLGGGAGPGASADLQTEIVILQSDRIVADALNSLSDEDFQQFTGAPRTHVIMTATGGLPGPHDEQAIAGIKTDLHVKAVGETQLLSIGFRNKNPQLAAKVVNNVVAAYIKENFESRYGSVSQAQTWLSTQMTDLKSRAADSQKKLVDFQQQNGILATVGSTTTTDNLKMLDERLTAAQADRILKEAQMRAAKTGNPAVLASLFPNPKLQALLAEQGKLAGDYAQLSSKYAAQYTPLVQLRDQMQQIDGEIKAGVQLVQARLQEEFNAARANEEMLQSESKQQTEKAYTMNRQQAELSVLQSEGTASRELYNTLEFKLQQAGINAGLNGVNTMLIDSARPPEVPVGPQNSLLIFFGLAIGFVVGIGAVFLVEMSVDSVQNMTQLTAATGYYGLGTIPHIEAASSPATGSGSCLVALNDPLSAEADSFRKLRNQLVPSAMPTAPTVLMIASAEQDEGKSVVTANYGVVLAQTGATVLLVDAELRRPSLHSQFSIKNGEGLSESLTNAGVAPAFQQPIPTMPNLSVLTAGALINFPSEALASSNLRLLLGQWEKQFDFVLVKTAPLLVVSDGLPLAGYADGVVLVTRYGKTRLETLKRLRESLQHVGANVAGVLINDATRTQDGNSRNLMYGKESQ